MTPYRTILTLCNVYTVSMVPNTANGKGPSWAVVVPKVLMVAGRLYCSTVWWRNPGGTRFCIWPNLPGWWL